MKWIASAAFGLEGQTMRDLKRLGAANAQTMNCLLYTSDAADE